MSIDLEKMSASELEALLKQKRKEEREKRMREHESYEVKRDKLVSELMSRAKTIHSLMRDFKVFAIKSLKEFREIADSYGDIRSNSKGGFSLRHRETQEVVSLDRNVVAEYDERAAIAEQHIKDFLLDKVKKRNLATYRTITALLVRNKMGDFTTSRIASLLSIKDNYDDERWIKAMELFEKSFRIREKSYSVSFYKKNSMQKDESIPLSFSAISIDDDSEGNTETAETIEAPKTQEAE